MVCPCLFPGGWRCNCSCFRTNSRIIRLTSRREREDYGQRSQPRLHENPGMRNKHAYTTFGRLEIIKIRKRFKTRLCRRKEISKRGYRSIINGGAWLRYWMCCFRIQVLHWSRGICRQPAFEGLSAVRTEHMAEWNRRNPSGIPERHGHVRNYVYVCIILFLKRDWLQTCADISKKW